jgi:hypothetical protein
LFFGKTVFPTGVGDRGVPRAHAIFFFRAMKPQWNAFWNDIFQAIPMVVFVVRLLA